MTVVCVHLRVSIRLGQGVLECDSCMVVMSERLSLVLWPCQSAGAPGCPSFYTLPDVAALQGKEPWQIPKSGSF